MISNSDIGNAIKYKRSNYQTYNQKVLDTYDDCFWISVFKLREMDQSVVQELQYGIGNIHILDVGCATGRLIETLYLAGAKHLYATDIAPKILDRLEAKAKKQNFHVELKVADAEIIIPWESNKFDAIILSGVYHHFINPDKALREIYRVLRRNGRLIITEPRFPIIIRQVLNLYLKLFMHEGDHKFYTPKKITKVTQSIGFIADNKPKNVARLMFKTVYRK